MDFAIGLAYIFQRPFLRGLFLEGLLFGAAYIQKEIGPQNRHEPKDVCVSKSRWASL